jgi:hypothetical protein
MAIGPELLALLFACAAMIGCLDAICGAGGLVTVPLLLSLGFDPTHALATNKLQGALAPARRPLPSPVPAILDMGAMAPAVPCAAIGAALGTLTVQHVDPSILRPAIPAFLIGVSLYFIFMKPTRAASGRPPLVTMKFFAPVAAGGVAFYDGLLGMGTGAIFVAAIAGLLGQALRGVVVRGFRPVGPRERVVQNCASSRVTRKRVRISN